MCLFYVVQSPQSVSLVLNKAICYLEFSDHFECDKAYELLVKQINQRGLEKKSKGVCTKMSKLLKYYLNKINKAMFGDKEVLSHADNNTTELLFSDYNFSTDEVRNKDSDFEFD